jgi:uncharacterized protein (DUF58 family)
VRRRCVRVRNAALETITPLGWTVLIMAVLSIISALLWHWIEAWALALIGGVLIIIALPFLIGTRAYHVKIHLPKTQVVVGDQLPGSVVVHNKSVRPAMPAIAEFPVGNALKELTVPFLAPGARNELPFTVDTSNRGLALVGPLTVARQDPVGLFRREIVWRDRHRVYVHPRTVVLPAHTTGLVRDLEGTTTGKITDADLAFHAIREYVPGDDPRHVHWKSTAKTGKLMVRQYEETQSARVAILFDANLSSYADENEFELGVSIAASFALQAIRDGRERYVSAPHEIPTRSPGGLLDAFTVLQPADFETPIDTITRELAQSRRELSMVMVVSGSNVETKTLRHCAAVLPPSVVTLAARAQFNADPAVHRSSALTLATVGALEDLPHLLVRGLV